MPGHDPVHTARCLSSVAAICQRNARASGMWTLPFLLARWHVPGERVSYGMQEDGGVTPGGATPGWGAGATPGCEAEVTLG